MTAGCSTLFLLFLLGQLTLAVLLGELLLPGTATCALFAPCHSVTWTT